LTFSKVAAGDYGNIPPKTIVIVIDDGGDFVKSYQSIQNKTDSSCATHQICINSKGEISYEFECDGYGFEVSTSGEVKLTVSGITFPVKKGN
jgi:hypothetical protein